MIYKLPQGPRSPLVSSSGPLGKIHGCNEEQFQSKRRKKIDRKCIGQNKQWVLVVNEENLPGDFSKNLPEDFPPKLTWGFLQKLARGFLQKLYPRISPKTYPRISPTGGATLSWPVLCPAPLSLGPAQTSNITIKKTSKTIKIITWWKTNRSKDLTLRGRRKAGQAIFQAGILKDLT